MINGTKIKIGFQSAEGGFYLPDDIINGPLHLFIFFIKGCAQQVITLFFVKRFLLPCYVCDNAFVICLGIYIVILVDAWIFGLEPANTFPYLFLLFNTAFFIKAFFYL